MATKSDPANELVDVLDDEGNVVGVARRSEIRERKLRHRACYVLVFNPAGELLIHQRTETKDVFPSYWDVTVGGVLAAGETWEEGTKREIQEEIGVAAEPKYLFDVRYEGEHGPAFGKVYRAVHGGPFHLQAEEVVQATFVPVGDLPRLFADRRFCPDGMQVWDTYLVSFRSTD
jgi:isopentenyldiphosphate isomerase